MAEEAAVEIAEPVEPKVPETPPVEPAVEPAEQPEPVVEDDREPGGKDPQAVRARKEYQARRRVEQQLEQERLERVRMEGELKALKEHATTAAKPVVYTPDQIQAAIDAGTIKAAEGFAYLARIEAQRVREEAESQARAEAPLRQAQEGIQRYLEKVSWVRDQFSPEYSTLRTEYQRLINLGFPADVRTQLVALEKVAGPLEKIESRNQIDANTRATMRHVVDRPGGPAPTAKKTIADAPAHLVQYWDKTGTPQADREAEFKYWLASHSK